MEKEIREASSDPKKKPLKLSPQLCIEFGSFIAGSNEG